MANIGLPEFLVVLIIVALLGSPAILAIAFLGLRRAAQQGQPAPANLAAQARLRAAGYVHADGSLGQASPEVSVTRLQTGIYQVTLPTGLELQRCLLQATPVADQAADQPALVEQMGSVARNQSLAAGAAEGALLVWVRLANGQPVDRDWTFQIIEWV